MVSLKCSTHILWLALLALLTILLHRGGSAHSLPSKIITMRSAETKTLRRRQLWGVTTTILEVNPAVRHFVSTFDANLVIIGDEKTNHSEWRELESSHANVMYLSPEQQAGLGFEVLRYIPWNHFGRKSIGFLVAIKNGAEIIYDFDDDNHLSISSLDEISTFQVSEFDSEHHVFNPYPHFKPHNDGKDIFVWPRGFPLSFINDERTHSASVLNSSEGLSRDKVAVVQSLADHDPDVDAIYRLTRKLPIYFWKGNTLLVPPRGTFTPWNAQAVLLRQPAFFGLLLPVTVTGRVSDIWRSYITTRLLWETGFLVGFSSPFVKQFRNPHSYMKDLEEEKDLYYNVDELLKALLEWNSAKCSSLEEAYLELIANVVSLGFLGTDDLNLAHAWCKDLKSAGYSWPRMSSRLESRTPKMPSVVDERRLGSSHSEGGPSRNAVCMIGTFNPDVEDSLREHVLTRMDADLFLVSARKSNALHFTSIRVVGNVDSSSVSPEHFFNSAVPTWNKSAPGVHLGGLPGHKEGHGAYQLKDRWDCERLISAHEKKFDHRYTYVGVGRGDLLWLEPHPLVEPFGCWIPCQANDWGGFCDHWAWCERGSASTYMTAPVSDLPILSNDMINTERHLKMSLDKHNIHVERGDAAFIRLCPTSSDTCKLLPRAESGIGSPGKPLYAKKSGGQIEVAKNELLKSALITE